MNENKLNFTVATLNGLPLPRNSKRAYYYDTKTPGLGVMVFPSGTKTFFLYKRVDGKPDKIKLGRFPEMSIEQARKEAIKLLNTISAGGNPNHIKRTLRNETCFAELFHKYLEQHAKPRKLTWSTDKGYYDRYLMQWEHKKISQISRNDVQKLHNSIREQAGLYAANRTLALICTLFNKAMEWGFAGPNPAQRIKKFTETPRDRFLEPHEIGSFFEALEQEPNKVIKSFFYICLLTGARRNNVITMRWDQLHLGEHSYWNIPMTKNGQPQTVVLVPQAVEILKLLKENMDSEWVFPSKASRSGHMEEPKSAWKRILKRASLTNLRIHDLRRTMASWQVQTGANNYIIGKTLGHSSHHATAVYARVSKNVERTSMEKAVNAMLEYAK